MPEEFHGDNLISKLFREDLYAYITEEGVWMTTVERKEDPLDADEYQILIGVEEDPDGEPYKIGSDNYHRYIDEKTIMVYDNAPNHIEQRLSLTEPEQLPSGIDGDDSQPNERFPWEPDISVAAIGETGRTNIDQIRSLTSVTFLRNPSPEELSEDTDFLFISADMTEPNVVEKVHPLLETTDAVSIVFAEGLTARPDDLIEKVNLLIPTQLGIMPRDFYPMFIADLFEVMLPLTIQDLGKGDIKTFAGEHRIGKIFLDTPNDDHEPVDFTAGVGYDTAEYLLFFSCSGEKQPPSTVQSKIEEYDFPEELAVLSDQRIHPRYTGRPHTKYFISASAGDNITWNREEQT